MKSDKMDWRFPKDTKDYRSFDDFLPTSTIHNSIFRDFEWFKFQNVIQEVYFMPSFLVKRKFQVEGHVWMQNIIGHFWRKIWNISKYGKSTPFLQLWLNETFSSSIHLISFFFHYKDCNIIFLKHQESCPKTPWAENAIVLKLVT